MPKRYAPEFGRAVCARLVAGETVKALSSELGVSEATLHLWKRQALIDAGRAEGIKSFEADELAQAHKTTRALARVNVGPLDPAAQRLVADPQLASDPRDHRLVVRVLLSQVQHHAHCPLFQLRRVPLRGGLVLHDSILASKVWSLLDSQADSM